MGFNLGFKGLNPICHLLALLGANPILHVGGIRVNSYTRAPTSSFCQYFFMKYVIVTPQYKKENEELKQTGSDSTIELPTDPHTHTHTHTHSLIHCSYCIM
jgi:hypothetical protein